VIRISAPGKMMIAGEYAVLHGRRALVAAVDRRVLLTFAVDGSKDSSDDSRGRAGLPPEAAVARKVAEARLGEVPGTMSLDVSHLRSQSGAQKLGLGSSSAAAVAAAAAVHAFHGRDVTNAEARREILADAMRGHHQVAPQGSGADVAAATLGGITIYRREAERFDAAPSALPEGVVCRVAWTGKEARTSELVHSVAQLRERAPAEHDAAIARIAEAAEAMIDAADRRAPRAWIEAVEAHGEAMAELGARAEVPIVEERLLAVMSLAAEAGGAAKPSGAGGGDVALAFFESDDATRRFEAACAEADFTLLSLQLGARGVAPEETDDVQ
jgi:phosphomevalonate kinase